MTQGLIILTARFLLAGYQVGLFTHELSIISEWNYIKNTNRNRSPSQNHRTVGVGRDLCGSSSPTPLPKQGHLQHTACFNEKSKPSDLHLKAWPFALGFKDYTWKNGHFNEKGLCSWCPAATSRCSAIAQTGDSLLVMNSFSPWPWTDPIAASTHRPFSLCHLPTP